MPFHFWGLGWKKTEGALSKLSSVWGLGWFVSCQHSKSQNRVEKGTPSIKLALKQLLAVFS